MSAAADNGTVAIVIPFPVPLPEPSPEVWALADQLALDRGLPPELWVVR